MEEKKNSRRDVSLSDDNTIQNNTQTIEFSHNICFSSFQFSSFFLIFFIFNTFYSLAGRHYEHMAVDV